MDLLNSCRFCVKEVAEQKRILISADIRDKFKYLTDLNLRESDLFSDFSCSSCIAKLAKAIEIKSDFISKQNFLREISNQSFKKEETPQEGDVQEIPIKSENEFVSIKEEPIEIDPASNLQVEMPVDDKNLASQSLANKSKFETKDLNRESTRLLRKKSKSRRNDEVNTENHQEDFSLKQKTPKSERSKQEKKRCNICGEDVLWLKHHIENIHYKKVRFICNECNKGFYYKQKLIVHLRRHFNILTNTCSNCGKSFFSKNLLNLHIKCVHEQIRPTYKPQKKVCDVCGKTLCSLYVYNMHMLSQHQGEKSFSCDFEGCSQKFSYKEALLKHKRMKHEPTKFLQCPICSKTVKHTLNLHMKTNHKQRMFTCDFDIDGKQCGKKYAAAYLLRNHVNISHRLIKEFQCDKCEASYSKLMDLENHRNVIHLKLKIKCEICPTLVTKKDYYRRHVLLHHKELDETTKNALLEKIKKTSRKDLFNAQLPVEMEG